jgi:CheY-like chemotaxis protein
VRRPAFRGSVERRATFVTRLRLLIVDDEPMFTQALRRLLQRTHDVEVAGDGQEALAVVSAAVRSGRRFDVILSDVMMPAMSGIELLENLLEIAPEQARQFVFLTGGTFGGPTQKRLRALGTRQLEKPVDVAALRTMIDEVASGGPASEDGSGPAPEGGGGGRPGTDDGGCGVSSSGPKDGGDSGASGAVMRDDLRALTA